MLSPAAARGVRARARHPAAGRALAPLRTLFGSFCCYCYYGTGEGTNASPITTSSDAYYCYHRTRKRTLKKFRRDLRQSQLCRPGCMAVASLKPWAMRLCISSPRTVQEWPTRGSLCGPFELRRLLVTKRALEKGGFRRFRV